MSNQPLRYCLPFALLLSLLSGNAVAAELAAVTDWSQRVVLSTTVTGVIDKVEASAGQKLKKGDLLLQLDQREFKAALDQAKAQRLAAKTTYEESERELERSQELYDRTMLSEHELQTAKNNAALAKADYLEAKARVLSANVALQRSQVRAPFDCLVLKVMALPGQTVLSSLKPEPLAMVADSQYMRARAWLNQTEVDQYTSSKAQQVHVGNQVYDVIEQHIAYEANDKGQYALDVIFNPGNGQLRAGQTARIIFP
jgi:multidrug efflux system membrane fusion protein